MRKCKSECQSRGKRARGSRRLLSAQLMPAGETKVRHRRYTFSYDSDAGDRNIGVQRIPGSGKITSRQSVPFPQPGF